jgi:hypothetical protein
VSGEKWKMKNGNGNEEKKYWNLPWFSACLLDKSWKIETNDLIINQSMLKVEKVGVAVSTMWQWELFLQDARAAHQQ